MPGPQQAEKPTDVTPERGFFDRFAEMMSKLMSRSPFFATCLMVVIVWGGIGPMLGYSDAWQLVINTGTAIVTFLMVALLQNSARRSDQALQHKLNAIADALADFMEKAGQDLGADVAELRAAVGLEDREATSQNLRSGKK